MKVGWGGSSWLLCVHLDVSRVFKVAGIKGRLMFQDVTAKSFNSFFPPTPEDVAFRLYQKLR